MPSAAQIFVKAMNRRVGELSGYWPLGTPVKLGDYGTYSQGFFQRVGNIFEEGLVSAELNRVRSGPAANHEFKTEGQVTTKFQIGANVEIPDFSAKATFSIQFSGRESFYFNALVARVVQLESPGRIGSELISLDEAGRWKREFHVVTTIVEAQKVRFLVAGASSSSIEFVLGATNSSPAAPALPTQLNADLTWVTTSESNLSYQYSPELMAEPVTDTPFFQLHKVSRRTFPIRGPRYWDTLNVDTRGLSLRIEDLPTSDEDESASEPEYSFEPAHFFDDSAI